MFLVLFYRFFEVKKFNGIISKTVRSALNTLTSRDDVIHDVKVSCIVSRVVEVVQQIYWYRFQGFRGREIQWNHFQDCTISA